MQNGHVKLTSPNRFYGYTESIGVRVVAVRCVSIGSLLLRPINAKLTMLSAELTPLRLTLNKYNTSQDGIDFSVVLSVSCLRALRLARSTSSRAFFVAFGFSRCVLSISLPVSPILLPYETQCSLWLRVWLSLPILDAVANRGVSLENVIEAGG